MQLKTESEAWHEREQHLQALADAKTRDAAEAAAECGKLRQAVDHSESARLSLEQDNIWRHKAMTYLRDELEFCCRGDSALRSFAPSSAASISDFSSVYLHAISSSLDEDRLSNLATQTTRQDVGSDSRDLCEAASARALQMASDKTRRWVQQVRALREVEKRAIESERREATEEIECLRQALAAAQEAQRRAELQAEQSMIKM